VTLNAGVTPVTNLTTLRARRLVTVASDAVCYVVVRESRHVGSSGTRVLSSIGLALRCYWHAAAIGTRALRCTEAMRCAPCCFIQAEPDQRLVIGSAFSPRQLQLGTQVVHTVSQTVTAGLARCERMAAVLVALVRLG